MSLFRLIKLLIRVITPLIFFYFYAPCRKIDGENSVFVLCLTVCLSVRNFNFAHDFCMVNDGDLIFHIFIPCDKTFH